MKLVIAEIQRPFAFGSTVSGIVMLATLTVDGLTRAADAPSDWFRHSRENAWLQSYDPTLISRRVFSEFSFEDQDRGDSLWKVENSLRASAGLRDDLAVGVQGMVPLKWRSDPDSDAFGFGDLEARVGLVGRFSPTLRFALACNAVFDTASESELGGNAFVLRPIVAVRWDASKRLNIGINGEFNFTPFDEGSAEVSALELKFPAVFKLTDDWVVGTIYKPRWNLVNASNRHRLECSATRIWGTRHQYALTCGVEVPLVSESLDLKLVSGFSWFF